MTLLPLAPAVTTAVGDGDAGAVPLDPGTTEVTIVLPPPGVDAAG